MVIATVRLVGFATVALAAEWAVWLEPEVPLAGCTAHG